LRRFLRGGFKVSGNWSVTCIGRLDCGVLENRSGESALLPRGPGSVIARLGGGLGAADDVLAEGGFALCGRTTCVTT
jgi:hypothetical protein